MPRAKDVKKNSKRSSFVSKKKDLKEIKRKRKANRIFTYHTAGRKDAPAEGGIRRKWKPGTVAIREIKAYQKNAQLLVQRAPFSRVVREIAKEIDPEFRFSPNALEALQEATEGYIVGIFTDANLCSVHANRMTLFKKDMQLAMRIRGDNRSNYLEDPDSSFVEIALPYKKMHNDDWRILQKQFEKYDMPNRSTRD